ncbi:M15 family metallopeptidase [Agrococcus sp. SGAir0287]|uniref:M15 family metallopeptidase n=1 Tax=Agrococcus sp. SGAir0287 TaxID=2070347 RepID=UPI0010CCBB6F|nr:M15 family metallopeptidase [Agrococcus sp. SGAir0287]QCR18639.1 hypothetical protein C1N71_03555 [Agrococcus sp. SGAir0287]
MSTAAPVLRRRRRLALVVGCLVVVALATCAVPPALQWMLAAVAAPTSSVAGDRGLPPAASEPGAASDSSVPGVDDGLLPGGPVSPHADVPAVSRLDPALLSALRAATDAAAAEGFEIVVNSGWRSAALQQAMLDEAIVTYGSAEEAARWVSTPDESAHVTGDAVDVGDLDGASWLGGHGWAWGLCQTYANESWHFELRPEAAADGTCPPMATDPTAAH